MADFDVFFVGLHCSLSELKRREILRGNRRQGEALADYQTVHTITSYDLELDSENSLEDNIILLIKSWKERNRPSELDQMVDEMNKLSASEKEPYYHQPAGRMKDDSSRRP